MFSQVLSEEMPLHLGISQCLPTPLHWRGLRALTKSPVPFGIVSEREICHGMPRAPEYTLPIGQNLWQNMHNWPFLIVSAIKEKISWLEGSSKQIPGGDTG